MLYKFKSKATGDLIMMQPSGDQVLRIVGRERFEIGKAGAGEHFARAC